MWEIEIRFWGGIAYYLPEVRGRFSVKKSVEPGETVQELVESLKLPKELSFFITVNSRVIEREYTLRDGDKVALYPPLSGG